MVLDVLGCMNNADFEEERNKKEKKKVNDILDFFDFRECM